jgi:hypothetical protein
MDVIRRVEALGGQLVLADGSLRVRAPQPLPDDVMAALAEHKASVMVALGAPIDVIVASVLRELRPHLPRPLQVLPDDRLLVLVNWSIIAAFEKAIRSAAENSGARRGEQ